MFVRSILSACLLSATALASASDGMLYVAVYECNAEEINRNMVETCSREFPALSAEADKALTAWRGRNLAKANAARDKCARERSEASKRPRAPNGPDAGQLMADAKAEMSAGFEARIQTEGEAACLRSIKQLGQAGGPVDIR